MGLVALILTVILIVILDRRMYNTYYTPSIFLSVPFLAICILYDLNAERLGYYKLNYDVLYIWVFGLFFFWFAGVITNLIVPVKIVPRSTLEKENDVIIFSKKLTSFTFFLSIILTYFLYNAFRLYITSGGDVVEEYLGKGFQAHLILQLKFLSIFSFLSLFVKGKKVHKLQSSYIVFVSLALSVFYGTKSGILLLLISYFFAWVFFFNKRITLVHIISALVFGFGVFYISYSMVFGDWAPVEDIFNHMILYYVSGTAGMNAYFSSFGSTGLEPEMIFRPIFNTIALISGNREEVKVAFSDIFTNIGEGRVINVRTFFGTLYMYGGTKIAILAIFIFSFICHLILKKGLLTYNLMYLALYTFILSIICFGWFDFYFNSLLFYETIAFALFLNLIFLTKKRNAT
ncbi:DUF6337 family protein [Sphingobacterium yanglingense]|uniref:Oligosaccharide repeat unit polymerase n=1 Tax=Sphingobacterium yanglingense TaxID=1437280 RepID=A0A4R6WEF1_9SPHI|nr:DUF6337 family protein [Sphingobacterium yanglingense]TDQ73500.1 oligosaccharide repeat unit polymerase [Sphingobacterium yanglingense]